MRRVLMARRFRRGAPIAQGRGQVVWSWTVDPAWLKSRSATTTPPQIGGPSSPQGPLSLVPGPDGVTVLCHDPHKSGVNPHKSGVNPRSERVNGHHAGPFDDMGAVLDALGPATTETEGLADAAYRFLTRDHVSSSVRGR